MSQDTQADQKAPAINEILRPDHPPKSDAQVTNNLLRIMIQQNQNILLALGWR